MPSAFNHKRETLSGSPHLPVKLENWTTAMEEPLQTLDNRQCRIMLLQWREKQGEPRNPLIFWLEAISTLQVQGEEFRNYLQKRWTNTDWPWGGSGGYILWDGVLKRKELHRKFQNCLGIHLSWTPIWACIGWNPQAWQRTITYKMNNC